MTTNGNQATDVVIIGGGPAGSALGSYLSKAGIKNVIFESALHPRPHVGESLVPSTTRVFNDIDFLEVMEREGFVKKYGAAWHPPTGKGEFGIEFAEFPQEGVTQNHTYHVDRAKFDMLLLKHAEGLGSKIYEGIRVKEVLFDGERACGVRVDVEGHAIDIHAKVVVDASGRQTVLGRQLGLKNADPVFNQFAVHAWYEDIDRGKDKDFIHIYFLPTERGWAWQIPITETVTSIGIVAEKSVFSSSKLGHEEWFRTQASLTPELERAMTGARRVNEFRAEGDYSYSMEKFCGDAWLLVGDAARFVDPIFSSGVSVALTSAKFASESIKKAIETGDFSREALVPYEKKLKDGVAVWYEFISLYYKLLPLFTYFIQSKKHRLQVLQLLQGDVYDRGRVEVLDAMRDYIKKVEEAPDDHIFKKSLVKDIKI